ncbi:MAG: cyanoexosortase A [Coleofasciculus sp. G1-WW12-02]|uniref:cyanoexosortase A n=1 Tax=Coleofasciculus sp. G1-WW12-02 TaxID=3068483 RepID=UPI0032F698BA
MKATSLTPLQRLKIPPYWLLAIAAGLVAIYMTLGWKAGDEAQLGMSVLFWLAVGSLLWGKRHELNLESGVLPSIAGALVIAFVLWDSARMSTLTLNNGVQRLAPLLRLLPFISAIGVGLLASGFKGLKQYWQELTILFFLGGPSVIASFIPDISPITAKFSAFMLWYMGFQVYLYDKVFINLPDGGVKVYHGCSGMEAMTYVLGLSVICLIMFPIAGRKQYFVPIMALIVGFVVNSFRVALMAVLANAQNMEAFKYWHEGEGSLVFGMISVMVFGVFYWLLLRMEDASSPETEEA